MDKQTEAPADMLEQSITRFMRYFIVHMNPVLHRTIYKNRSYNENEIMVIMALDVVGPLSPTQLSRGLGLQKGSLSSVLRRLEDLGLIERQDNSSDERSYLAVLSAPAAHLVQHLKIQRQTRFREMFNTMDEAAITQASKGLDLISTFLEELEDQNADLDPKSRP